MLGLAQTGTGKTAAFVLPILQRLAERPPRTARGPRIVRGDRKPRNVHGPRALVVLPTRELATQVMGEFERLGRHTRVRATAVFGGVPIPRQQRALAAHPDVVVACPGRLLDLLDRRALRLDRVEVLVLDEADHMFDMGFLPDLRRILAALPRERQNMLFSATMPREIRKLADTVLREPEVVELAHSRPAETIEHALYQIRETEKVSALESLLARSECSSAIVFLRTKHRAKRLARRLGDRGHAAVAMQGNMSQAQREKALRGFREGSYDVLVATDIAARGLDVAGISHVVNFDVPNTPDAYTHRIGRTGRSEERGVAFTFVTPQDAAALRAIEQRLGAAIERRSVKELGRIEELASPSHGDGGQGRRPYGGARKQAGARKGGPAWTKHGTTRSTRATRKTRTGGVQRLERSRPAPHRGPSFGQGVFPAGAIEERAPRPGRRRRRARAATT